MSARDLACSVFWSEHPLCELYMIVHDAKSFSLRQLIEYAESLPQAIIDDLATS
jgi:hypothetical protein